MGLGEGGEAPPSRRRDPTGHRDGPVPERAAREVSAPGGWGDDLERHRRVERGGKGPLDPRARREGLEERHDQPRRARRRGRHAIAEGRGGQPRGGDAPVGRARLEDLEALGGLEGFPPDRDEDSIGRQRHDLSEAREAPRGARR